MTYQVKTVYPKEESVKDNKFTERTFNEFIEDVDSTEVIDIYNSLLSQGYSVTASFNPADIDSDGEVLDVFEIAKKLELAGIPYKATLKLKKAEGDYELMLKLAKAIESYGYDFDFVLKGKVNEHSTIDFEKQKSWFDPDFSKFEIKPKVKSDDINELKSLYDLLVKDNYNVSIGLVAKVKKDDDEAFSAQLDSYPDGTEVVFKLKDAEL